MTECPGNTADAKTTCYFRVLINVMRIIVVNEVVPERLAKNKPCKHSDEIRCKRQRLIQGGLLI